MRTSSFRNPLAVDAGARHLVEDGVLGAGIPSFAKEPRHQRQMRQASEKQKQEVQNAQAEALHLGAAKEPSARHFFEDLTEFLRSTQDVAAHGAHQGVFGAMSLVSGQRRLASKRAAASGEVVVHDREIGLWGSSQKAGKLIRIAVSPAIAH